MGKLCLLGLLWLLGASGGSMSSRRGGDEPSLHLSSSLRTPVYFNNQFSNHQRGPLSSVLLKADLKDIQLRQLHHQQHQYSGNEGGRADAFDRDYGVLLGRLSPRAHGIHGLVYAVDETHLFIRNFRYDGTGPDAYFWVGDDPLPCPEGHIIPYPPLDESFDDPERLFPGNKFEGRFDGRNRESTRAEPFLPPTLKKMHNENVLLTLPGSLKISSIRWLAVWCIRFTVSYGFVLIPPGLNLPRQELLGPFSRSSNVGKLSSGRIKILDSKSFYVPNLQLHLTESGYHFTAGNGSHGPDQNGVIVPNEKAQVRPLETYNGNDIILTLPGSLQVYDINYLGIYSPSADRSLGHVSFDPRALRIPPALGQTKKPGWWFDAPLRLPKGEKGSRVPGGSKSPDSTRESFIPFNAGLVLPNCRELLGRKIRLLWKNEGGGSVYFRLKVHMERNSYAALGIAPGSAKMIDADMVKIYYNNSAGRFETVDSFLSKATNCDFENGLCADTIFNSGNDVSYMGSIKNTGLSIVDFRRSILPKDAHDAPIALYEPTQVLVAIGSGPGGSGDSGSSLYPHTRDINLEKENTTINFSSPSPETNCPESLSSPPGPPPPSTAPSPGWAPSVIRDRSLFVARLGPPGGSRGYGALTGNPPLINVVWWINGLLMPEIYVTRGRTYAWRVQGGDDPSVAGAYHPLYITDNPEGGYILKPQYERSVESIYAGVEPYELEPLATGLGPLCEFVSREADKAHEAATFLEYKRTLRLACTEGRENEYGWVNWTVDHNTPDLLYYQSFADYAMGWKIHVLDEGEVPPDSSGEPIRPQGALVFLLLLVIHHQWTKTAFCPNRSPLVLQKRKY